MGMPTIAYMVRANTAIPTASSIRQQRRLTGELPADFAPASVLPSGAVAPAK